MGRKYAVIPSVLLHLLFSAGQWKILSRDGHSVGSVALIFFQAGGACSGFQGRAEQILMDRSCQVSSTKTHPPPDGHGFFYQAFSQKSRRTKAAVV